MVDSGILIASATLAGKVVDKYCGNILSQSRSMLKKLDAVSSGLRRGDKGIARYGAYPDVDMIYALSEKIDWEYMCGGSLS